MSCCKSDTLKQLCREKKTAYTQLYADHFLNYRYHIDKAERGCDLKPADIRHIVPKLLKSVRQINPNPFDLQPSSK